jgi:hypothetical protein
MSEKDSKGEPLFINLVLMFQMAAWQYLGKIKNPATDKIERNLEQAHFSIDTLEMIRKKTAGNLSDDEKLLIDHAISELQLNFVDEMEKDKKEKSKTDSSAEKKEQPEAKVEQAANPQTNENKADAS